METIRQWRNEVFWKVFNVSSYRPLYIIISLRFITFYCYFLIMINFCGTSFSFNATYLIETEFIHKLKIFGIFLDCRNWSRKFYYSEKVCKKLLVLHFTITLHIFYNLIISEYGRSATDQSLLGDIFVTFFPFWYSF